MGFDASGTFSRTVGEVTGDPIWQGDAAAGTRILASRHDSHDQSLANGLSECLTRTGKGVPAVDIPWGGKKITNLGAPTPGTADAATALYVEGLSGKTTAKEIGGSDLNGRINFTNPAGVNGITWTYADLAWVARGLTSGEANQRLVMTPTKTPDTTGPAAGLNDVFVIDDVGHINTKAGTLTDNVSYESATTRTVLPGIGTILGFNSGAFSVSSNDVATVTNNYASFTPRTFFSVGNSAGSSILALAKSASGKVASIRGQVGTEIRWDLQLGNTAAESGTAYVGSDFALLAYNNSGLSGVQRMHINRSTGDTTFAGDVYSDGGHFNSSTGVAVLSAALGGVVYLRPNGPTSTAEQVYIDTNGDLHLSTDLRVGDAGHTLYGSYLGAGLREKSGQTGSYGEAFVNFNGTATSMHVYHGTSDLGLITWQCDYRMKRDVQPLDPMWDKVKSLNPIKYMPRAFGPFWDDGVERWGFVAHEMQEKLTATAAEGEKDAENQIQSLNLIAVVAALTKALQEAMARIEALEAAA